MSGHLKRGLGWVESGQERGQRPSLAFIRPQLGLVQPQSFKAGERRKTYYKLACLPQVHRIPAESEKQFQQHSESIRIYVSLRTDTNASRLSKMGVCVHVCETLKIRGVGRYDAKNQ